MTQTSTDYSIPVGPPLTDRSFGAASSDDEAGTFGDHLTQASKVTADDSRATTNRASSYHSAAYSARHPDQASQSSHGPRHTNDSKHASHRKKDSSNKSPTPTADAGDSATTASNKDASADKDAHTDDTDKLDVSAKAAAASQAAAASAQQAKQTSGAATSNSISSAVKPTLPGDSIATADDKAAAKRTATESSADVNQLLPSAADDGDQIAKSSAKATPVADVTEQQAIAELQAHESNSATAAKISKVERKDNAGDVVDAKIKDPAEDQSASAAASVNDATSLDTNQASLTAAQLGTASANATTDGASDTAKSSDDSSQRDSRKDNDTAAQNDAALQLKQVDVALPPNAAAGASNTDAKAANKNEVTERTAKPITTKSDATAAAFSRFARPNSDTGVGSASRNGNDGPQVDPARFVGRVAKAFQTAQDRGGTLQIRLSPPELGSLHLSLTVKNGAISAALHTDNDGARRLLLDHLPALRDRLVEHNMRIDRFDVDVRRDDAGPQADMRGSQQRQFQNQSPTPAPRRSSPVPQRPAETVPAAPLPMLPTISDAGLNLIV
ncbi:MAG TPA: flagellar hook-length control protein FliK [Lacipirellulaceae bacterium]|nr:flagellar hook-length control protein FliK [Lacipirellulaceae bacterium]